MSTSTVWAKPGWSKGRPPAAYFGAGVVGEAIDRLPVGQALEALEHHHDRHDEGRDRAPPDIGEEVREQLVGEEVEAFPVEQGMDRVRRNPRTAELGRAPEDVSLAGRGPERHGGSCDPAGSAHPFDPGLPAQGIVAAPALSRQPSRTRV